MRLHDSNNYVESNIKGRSRSFGIEASHKAFKILSDSLYKDKISAVIRELSTNALDAHVEAGNDAPFEVHLPTVLEPHFSVTDYGVGMDQEQVATLYTTYFSSSKTDSNDAIGALGLGSKSPFSYTDAFNITSIKNGRKGIYSCFIGDEGTPTVQLIDELDTDEHNGVTISFSVREQDFETFITKAARIYWAFDRKPVITGAVNRFAEVSAWWNEVVVRSTSDGWTFYSELPNHLATNYRQRAQVKMGNIIYPIAYDMLGNLNHKAEFALRNAFIINMPLGSCDIAPSREELNYDEETIQALHIALEQTADSFLTQVVEEAGSEDTAWKAMVLVQSKLDRIQDVPEFTLTYNGKDYQFGQQLIVDDLRTVAVQTYVEHSRSGSRTTLADRGVVSHELKITPHRNVRFVVTSKDNQMTSYHYRARVKHFIQSTEGVSQIVLLRGPYVEAEDLEKLGNPEVIYFDNLPKTPRAPRGSRGTGRGIQPARLFNSSKEIAVEKIASYRKSSRKAFVVQKGQAWYEVKGGDLVKLEKDDFSNELRQYHRAELLEAKDLILVPYMTWKSMKDTFTDKWVTLKEFVEPKIRTRINKLLPEYAEANARSSVTSDYDNLVRNLDVFEAEQFSTNSLFRTFINTVADVKANSDRYSDVINKMRALIRAGQMVRSAATYKVVERATEATKTAGTKIDLASRYPLLSLMSESWELRREGALRKYTFDGGNVSRREDGQRSAADAIVEYIKLVDAAA